MKTILFATDYSEVAGNAMRYAVEFAKYTNARLILFHSYHPRVLLSSLTLMDGGFEEENLEQLHKYENQIRREYGDKPEIEVVTKRGFAVDEILNVIREKNVDLVVMGLTGAGLVKEVLMGSTTISLIEKTQTPVMVIPPEAKFKVPEKIAVAMESHETISVPVGEKIREYVKMFNSKLLLFNLVRQEEPAVHGEGSEDANYETALGDLEFEVSMQAGEDMADELNSFVKSRGVGMLMLVPHSHKQLADIFRKSNTRLMAFHRDLPLLSIHE